MRLINIKWVTNRGENTSSVYWRTKGIYGSLQTGRRVNLCLSPNWRNNKNSVSLQSGGRMEPLGLYKKEEEWISGSPENAGKIEPFSPNWMINGASGSHQSGRRIEQLAIYKVEDESNFGFLRTGWKIEHLALSKREGDSNMAFSNLEEESNFWLSKIGLRIEPLSLSKLNEKSNPWLSSNWRNNGTSGALHTGWKIKYLFISKLEDGSWAFQNVEGKIEPRTLSILEEVSYPLFSPN